jgi:hypothetical protein
MALNPNIALGVRPLELPNQLAQYAQLSQIQNAQQANQLNQMQMAEYQRARAEEEGTRNFLGKADLTDPNVRAQLLTGYGKPGREIYGKLSEAEKAQTEEAARRAKLMQDTQAMYRDISGVISSKADAATFLQRVINDPALKGSPLAKIPLMEQVARIPEDPVGLDDWKKQFALGATKYISENKPSTQAINRSGQTDIVQTPGLGGVPKTVGTYADVPLPPAVLAQKKDIARAGATILPAQEKAFETELGKEQAGSIIKNRVAAQDAASIIDTVKTGRDIMKSGMITGAGADFLVNLNQGLKTVGIDAGFADAAANSQAFTANMAGNVGKLIKQFGAGTGLSDADREFAKDMAGGRISLDAKAINRILDINERAARNVITRHNKDVKGIKTNIPLEVEMPPETKAPAAVVTAPPSAIEYLRANPSMKGAFDAKYGAGAADRALKGQ